LRLEDGAEEGHGEDEHGSLLWVGASCGAL
jgi:hypothetical protein